jgi:hypothetical protein
MNEEEMQELVESWIKATEADFDSGDKDRFGWAIDEMLDLPRVEPEMAWEIIMMIINKKPSPKVISQLGAGPLEDIMVYHGNNFMEKIENMVAKNDLFKECMKSVWLDEDDLASYKKFYELANIKPPLSD